MISLERATKLYKTVIGVNDITLSLEAGAYGLLGPNGSGKTTLLNLITGQLTPTLGTVRVLRDNPVNNADLCRRIGVCPAIETVYSNVSGFDWVRYLMELHGFGRGEAGDRATSALKTVGMHEAMYRPMGGYSRGMRQRAKLAQAIAHDPALLILDEPFNGLDPVGRHELTEMLRDLINRGTSVLLASHILHEVEAITQSFLLICSGRLLASGSSEEVQSLLADIPNEIQILCDRPHNLAQRMLAEEVVDAARVDGDGLAVATRHPATVYQELPRWAEETDCRIHELQSANESLDVLFASLLKIHRGEM